MIDSKIEMKELGRKHPTSAHSKRSLIRTSYVCHRRRAAGRNHQVEEYKHTHTRVHTHTQAQNRGQKQKRFSSKPHRTEKTILLVVVVKYEIEILLYKSLLSVMTVLSKNKGFNLN